jgi:hypothetical protein
MYCCESIIIEIEIEIEIVNILQFSRMQYFVNVTVPV